MRLLQQNSRLRQENSRLTSKLADALMVVRIPTHIHDDDGDDDATVAASNLTDANLCGAVSEQWDGDAHPAAEVPTDDEDVAVAMDGDIVDGGEAVHEKVAVVPSVLRDSPSNFQSNHTAPTLSFDTVPTGTDDIRQIVTNNQIRSQDVEGLPLAPKRKRRRKRKRKRARRRKGQVNRRRPVHSPVTPPCRHDKARSQAVDAARTYESYIREFRELFNSNAAGYCPASGFDTTWHRKGIG